MDVRPCFYQGDLYPGQLALQQLQTRHRVEPAQQFSPRVVLAPTAVAALDSLAAGLAQINYDCYNALLLVVVDPRLETTGQTPFRVLQCASGGSFRVQTVPGLPACARQYCLHSLATEVCTAFLPQRKQLQVVYLGRDQNRSFLQRISNELIVVCSDLFDFSERSCYHVPRSILREDAPKRRRKLCQEYELRLLGQLQQIQYDFTIQDDSIDGFSSSTALNIVCQICCVLHNEIRPLTFCQLVTSDAFSSFSVCADCRRSSRMRQIVEV